jgi:hypothetical protein
MVETSWTLLPFPFTELAHEKPLRPVDMPGIIAHLLEDGAGLAGVLAAAMQHPECEQDDVRFAARHLAEHLHATVALWRQWHAQQAAATAVAE